MNTTIRRTATVIMLAVAVGGCGSDQGGGSVREQNQALQQRPHIEQITNTYEKMRDDIRQRLSEQVGPLQWIARFGTDTRGCGFDFQDVEGATSRSLETWTSQGNLPDNRWDQAVRIVAEITARYGFAQPRVIVNRPSDHEIRISDPYGGELIFGTAVNTTLSLNTGCHLSRDRHPGA
ncbi:MAG: LppA family lipoprotein [Pseudonocardiaceae bacterium]